MAAYRNPRSFSSARRPTHGTASPSRCCYPYTPASPQPAATRVQANLDHQLVIMHPHPHPQPLFPNSTPVTRSLPENPTSDLALPTLEHLANALHALAAEGSSSSRGRSGRHGRLPSCERRSSHRRKSRVSSQSRDRRPAGTRDSHHAHHELVEHVPASTWAFETAITVSPNNKLVPAVPQTVRKLHYVPATPSALYASPSVSLKQFSPAPVKEALPTPPPSHASSSPRQLPSSPPKRHYTPTHPSPRVEAPVIQLLCPTPPPIEPAAAASKSKFTRLVLAGRETAADDAAIEALMSSFDRIVDSLSGDDDDD
ncbi:hypothetical protein FRC07_000866 [Ceratobasidium sp. 392]|nr:hypothetical protein FRC07_000866 [Ceratobasidium sp. 392]